MRKLPDAGMLADFSNDLALLMGREDPLDPAFRGDLLRQATQWTMPRRHCVNPEGKPLDEIIYNRDGALYQSVNHARDDSHFDTPVVVDIYPAGTMMFPLSMAPVPRQRVHIRALVDTGVLSIPIRWLLELTAKHPQAITFIRRHSGWQQQRHAATHADLAYADAKAKLRWMKANHPMFYRNFTNGQLGSFLGHTEDTIRKAKAEL